MRVNISGSNYSGASINSGARDIRVYYQLTAFTTFRERAAQLTTLSAYNVTPVLYHPVAQCTNITTIHCKYESGDK